MPVPIPLLLAAFASLPSPALCDASSTLPVPIEAESGQTVDSTLAALYASGEDFGTFLGNVRARRAMWVKNWTEGSVPADVLATAKSIPGSWRILVSAVDGCSDSVNTIPYLARLVEQVAGLEMRIVQPGPGRVIMESHRSPDGRASTPTIVILDQAGRDVGCWVERPAELQARAMAAREAGTSDSFVRTKQLWYDEDKGASTVREVVDVIVAAASGHPRCDAQH